MQPVVRTAVVVAVALIASGCGARPGTAPALDGSRVAGLSQPAVPSVATAGHPAAPRGAAGELVASDRGLTLTVSLDRAEVAPGGSISVDVTIRNARTVPVVLPTGRCGLPVTMVALVPVPVDPSAGAVRNLAFCNAPCNR